MTAIPSRRAAPALPGQLLLTPDQFVAFAVFCAVALMIAPQGSALLGDPDTQWHIASGLWILDNRAFPATDPFSYTFAGQPWIAKEWGGQIALALAHKAGGWFGVAMLTTLCCALAFAIAARAAARRLSATLALTLAIACLMFANGGVLARPHIITLPLVAWFASRLADALDDSGGPRPPWALLPVMTIWANSHGLFTIGFVMAAAVGLQALIDARGRERLRAAVLWALFGAGLLAAACLNPYGLQPLWMTLQMADGEPTEFIAEWRMLRFSGVEALAYAVLALSVLACLRRPVANIGRLLIIVFVGYMMVKHVRFTVQFAVVACVFGALPLALWLKRPTQAAAAPAPFAPLAASLALAAAIIVGLSTLAPKPTTPSRVTPTAALEAARAAGLAGPVFNAYDFGGHLALIGVPTFIDGRTDQLYIGGWRRRLEAALNADGPQELAAFMAPYRPTWALLLPETPEARQIAALGWREVHRDAHAVVFRRD
jgi:hypothetical protein